MRRSLTTVFSALFILVAFAPTGVGAQTFEWNSARVMALVSRATAKRDAALADSSLRSYKAQAMGYLTFLAQISEGLREPPKVIKTDQIASDIYWKAPNYSKQYIKGRRDTLLLPTDINYHRDHLGIVQNNFPEIIRLGDGDEVRDVPHPLSRAGHSEYDYAIRDSLTISFAGQSLQVYEIALRPKDSNAPRAVGAVFVERTTADVVRMALSFTRAALKQSSLEDVTVVLENGLIAGKYWLPRQQSIEIRRTASWLDYPVRGIIRGRWEISGYELNADFSIPFMGPEIMVAPGSRISPTGMVQNPSFEFEGDIMRELPPDVIAATDADVHRVQEEARALVRQRALARATNLSLGGRGASDYIGFNRTEGFALGVAGSKALGNGFSFNAGVRYGFDDERIKWSGGFSYRRASGSSVILSAYRRIGDASAIQERSGVVNSFAAQEFGSDYTSPYRVDGVSLQLKVRSLEALQTTAYLALERHDSAGLNATSTFGNFAPVLQFPRYEELRAGVKFDLSDISSVFGTRLNAGLNIEGLQGRHRDTIQSVAAPPLFPISLPVISGPVQSTVSTDKNYWLRATLTVDAEKELPFGNFVSRSFGAAIIGPSEVIPVHRLLFLGGINSAPGYEFHQLYGNYAISQRLELRFKAPFYRIPLGAFGKAPGELTLAPYVNGAWVEGQPLRPSVGLGVLTLFDILRFDVARGLRDGRWVFGVDINRSFWGLL